ncbi:MAG TPA: ATP-binding protein, partial [Candidatus Saccharibacteria bacterium]|nr:ATP-binding protein [Candidatus Saccharibacteria bacterium]
MRTLSLNKPHLIVMVGIPGAGKSFFAEHFAQTFNAPIVSYDQIRTQLYNNPTFTDDEQEIVGRIANHMLQELFKSERTILYEGPSDLRTERSAISKLARDAGYETLFIWVQTESSSAKSRSIKAKNDKISNADEFNAKIKRFSAPHQTEHAVVISGKHTYASQLKIVLKRLVEPRAS